MRNFLLLILFPTLTLFSVAISSASFAEVASITLAAKVRAIDGDTIACETNGLVFKTKKSYIRQSPFHVGDPVLVTMPGDEVASLFLAPKENSPKINQNKSE
jgi:hypothetical protein